MKGSLSQKPAASAACWDAVAAAAAAAGVHRGAAGERPVAVRAAGWYRALRPPSKRMRATRGAAGIAASSERRRAPKAGAVKSAA